MIKYLKRAVFVAFALAMLPSCMDHLFENPDEYYYEPATQILSVTATPNRARVGDEVVLRVAVKDSTNPSLTYDWTGLGIEGRLSGREVKIRVPSGVAVPTILTYGVTVAHNRTTVTGIIKAVSIQVEK